MQTIQSVARMTFLFTAVLSCWPSTHAVALQLPPNILFVSVDDMSCDSVGSFGCRLAETTPNIDQLAAEGLKFEHAHVQVGNCMPSRNVMFSGRYPHNNGVEGFYQVKNPNYPVLVDLMKQRGYFTAIRGKVNHSTPYHPYAWDLILDNIDGKRAHPKNVQSYYDSTKRAIAAAADAQQPFCLLINVSDPHKPFYAMAKNGTVVADSNRPSRVFTADEVPVPGFLPDHPLVRKELAHYYSSVRRADDCVGVILKALDESGERENTVVVFLSDHGMPLPFAKTQLYHHSTRTPWIVRWPGVTKPGTTDSQHMISAVDLLPTLLDIAQIETPRGFDGRSFAPLLRGKEQDGRDMVFKEYNENSGGARHPMRSVQTRKYGYIFNPWSDGQRKFRTATTGTLTYRQMQKLAETDPQVAARLKLFDYRVREEFYDYARDPDALHNLIDDPAYQEEIDRLRRALLNWMVQTGDHALEAFRQRDNEESVQAYMQQVEGESAARRMQKTRARRSEDRAQTARKATRRRSALIKLQAPTSVWAGKTVTLQIAHQVPENLGQQSIHVTLKRENGKGRIERKVVQASGRGTVTVNFDVPSGVQGQVVQFAAFIGEDFARNLQHTVTEPVSVK